MKQRFINAFVFGAGVAVAFHVLDVIVSIISLIVFLIETVVTAGISV